MNTRNSSAYLTGMNGNYSSNPVRGLSEITDTNGFNSSFNGVLNNNTYKNAHSGGINGKTFLEKPSYENPKNMFHNNVGSNVLMEQIMSNKIFIDSSFQDHKKNPEPFKFIVKFNGIQPYYEETGIKFTSDDDEYEFNYCKYGSSNIKINGDSCVVIDKAFKNVKCVFIEELIMPIAICYYEDTDGSYKKSYNLAHNKYKYLILKINELSNERFYTNNKKIGNEAFIMKADKDICKNNHLWIPICDRVCYPASNLKNIDRLTIEICDDQNNRLIPQLDGKNHDFYDDYVKTIESVRTQLENNQPIAPNTIKKLSSLKEILRGLYPEIHMTIDTLDVQINTMPNYRQS